MAGVPAPLTKLNQAGQDALRQNLQGVSFSNSTPAPSTGGYAPSSNGVIGAMAGAANMAKTPPVGGMAGMMSGIPAIPKPQAATPSPAGDLGATLGKFAATFNAIPTGQAAPKIDVSGIAASRIAAQRAALAGSVAAYDASRKAAYDYAQKTTQGNRALLQFDNSNRGDQFGGSAREDLFRLQRAQGQEDTYANTQYNNDIAASDAKLAAFDAGAPGLQQDIENQLNQQNFTNTLAQNQDNRAQQTQDYNQSPTNPNNVGQTLNNQLTQLKLSDYPAQSQAAAQQTQQDLQTGKINQEAAQFKLDQLKDPNSPTNQAAQLDLQMKQIDASNYSQEAKLKLQQLQKQIADIGVVHTQPQTANQIEMDKVKLQTAQEQLKQLQNQTPKSTPIDPKLSSDNYATISQDLKDAKSADEANALIEANKNNLTDSDYKDLKKKVIDQF